jgi:hypothetical protein
MAALFSQSIQITQPGPTGASNSLIVDGGMGTAFEASASSVEADVEAITLSSDLGTLTLDGSAATLAAGATLVSLTDNTAQLFSATTSVSGLDSTTITGNTAELELSAAGASVSLAGGSLALDASGAVTITAAPSRNLNLVVSAGGQITGIPSIDGVLNETVEVPADGTTVGVPNVEAPAAGLLGVSTKGEIAGAVPGNVVWSAPILIGGGYYVLANPYNGGGTYLFTQDFAGAITANYEIQASVQLENNINSVVQVLDTSPTPPNPSIPRVIMLNSVYETAIRIIDYANNAITVRTINSGGGFTFTESLAMVVVGTTLYIAAKYSENTSNTVIVAVGLGANFNNWVVGGRTALPGITRVYSMASLPSGYLAASVFSGGAFRVNVYNTTTFAILAPSSGNFAAQIAIVTNGNYIYAVGANQYAIGTLNTGVPSMDWTAPEDYAMGGVAHSVSVDSTNTNLIITYTLNGVPSILSSTLSGTVLTDTLSYTVASPVTSYTISTPIVFPRDASNVSLAVVYTTSVGLGALTLYSRSGNTLTPDLVVTFTNVNLVLGFTYTSMAQAAFNFLVMGGGAPAVFNAAANWPGRLGETLRLTYDTNATPSLRLQLSADISAYTADTTTCQVNGIVA